jgi:hypothetical protein
MARGFTTRGSGELMANGRITITPSGEGYRIQIDLDRKRGAVTLEMPTAEGLSAISGHHIALVGHRCADAVGFVHERGKFLNGFGRASACLLRNPAARSAW